MIYQHENPIIINQVSNGWVVVLPVIQIPFDEMRQLKKAASIISTAQNKDQKLAEIELQVEEEQEKSQLPTVADLKQDNVHIFKNFTEVLAFLKFTFEQLPTEQVPGVPINFLKS